MLVPPSTFLAAPGSIARASPMVFTKEYGLRRLVYSEEHTTVLLAKQREMNMKHWPRRWKVQLIHRDNPDWDDSTIS
jgi:predicted GIY-YIG superfamily endonuclease